MILTVGDLKRHLAAFDDDMDLEFSGGLTFYRTKMRGENLAMIEFNEFEAILSERFRNNIRKSKSPFVGPKTTDR